MEQGIVKFFNEEKGFGFIARDNEEDVFVHYSQIDGGILHKDDSVEFSVEKTDRGLQATQVRKI